MTLYLLADAHLGAHEGDTEAFLRHMDLLRERGVEHLVLMGDIFHYYIGLPRWAGLFPSSVLKAWQSMSRDGIRISYLEGNRDFFLTGSPLEEAVSEVLHELNLELPDGTTLYMEHGDLINTHDRRYRMWRSLSKSAFTRVVLSLFPPFLLQRWVERTERRLKKTNFSYRRTLPMDRIHSFCKSHEDRDIIILGHFHERHESTVGRQEVILMPAWEDTQTAMELIGRNNRRWHTLS